MRLSVVSEGAGEVLVSNFTLSAAGGAALNATMTAAQGFVTGANAGGYTLTAIDVPLGGGGPHNFGSATLHKDSATSTPVATLAVPVDVQDSSTARLTAPPGTILDPDSTYYLVLDGGDAGLLYTDLLSEDADGLPDWEMLDVRLFRDENSTGAFMESAGPLLMRVLGHVNPDPDVLVSNIDQAMDGGLTGLFSFDVAQGFVTGAARRRLLADGPRGAG